MAAIRDTYSRRIVGWSRGSTLAAGLCLEALSRALRSRRPAAGSSITRIAASSMRRANTGKRLWARDLPKSMSRKANCYGNAMIESFWSTLKTESTARNHFRTRAQARLAVFDFIECFYNSHRRHSSIGGVSPVAFETLKNSTKNAPSSLPKKAEQARNGAPGPQGY